MVVTYSNDGWVLGHSRRGLLFDLLLDAQIFYIASSEHNLLIDDL